MLIVSEAYKLAMQRPVKTWDIRIRITLASTEVLNLGKDDIVLGSIQYTEGCTCTDTIQVGSTFSNSFDFALLNRDKRFNNYDFTKAKVEPEVGLLVDSVSSFEYVPLGVFYVVESPKKLSTMAISSLDSMSQANVPFDFFDIVYPVDAADLLVRACEKCGFTLSEDFQAEVRALQLSVHSFETSNITCRDLIAGAAALVAKNARFNRYGVLEAFWYTESSGSTNADSRTGQATYDDRLLQVTKVVISDNYSQAFSLGDDGYEIEIVNNPYIQNIEIAEEVLTRVLNRLSGLPYRVCKVVAVGDPAYQAGDIITHNRDTAENYIVPLMKLVYKFGGSMTLETLGTYPEEQQQQSKESRKITNLSDKSRKDYRELESKIEQTANSIRLEVSEAYVTQEELDQKVSTEVNILSDSFEVKVSSVQETLQEDLDNVNQDLQNKYQTIATTFQVTPEGAIVGKTSSNKKVVITDASVVIVVDDNPVSTFNDKGATLDEITLKVIHIGDITVAYGNDGHVTFS